MAVLQNTLHVVDYLVFALTLLISVLIGVFFAVRGGKQRTQGEYLLANRNMAVLPVAISIQVSFLSAILSLGHPAEMYTQGSQFYIGSLGFSMGALLAAQIFVPLLYPLKMTSAYEYLERRFNSIAPRLVGTFLTIITQVIYMAIASFAPSTALEAVTGFPVWASILLMNVITTLYTAIGGIKAVIWTDVFQAVIMLSGIIAIVIQGCIKVGGVGRVWDINNDYGRLNFFNFNPDPTQRHSFWSLVLGNAVTWMGTYGIFQPAVQRYCSLPTLKKAKIAVLINIGSALVFVTLACFSGIVVFAYYVTKNCDPLGKKLIDNPNQIIPFFVMETLAYPAVPGLFLSSLYAGALSSISSSLNALAALTWEDILKRHYELKWSETKKVTVTKCIVVLFGCFSLAFSLVVQNLEGTVVQMSLAFLGSGTGPMIGLFLLGGLFPWANAKGAVCGGLVSLGVGMWFSIGAYVTGLPRDKFRFPNGTCDEYLDTVTMATTTTLMSANSTTPATSSPVGSDDGISGIEEMYTVSYLWYSSIGMATCVGVGLIVSFLTGPNSLHDIPTKYQIPLVSRLACCLPRSWQSRLNCYRNFDHQYEDETPEDKSTYPPDEKDGLDNATFTPDHVTGEKTDKNRNVQNGVELDYLGVKL